MSSMDTYDAAISLFEAGNYKEAIETLEPLALQGHIEALSTLGSWYMILPELLNIKKAIAYLTEAATKGSGLAAHNLGTLYSCPPVGIEADHKKSQYWYQVAYDFGFEASVSSDPLWWKQSAT